MTCDEFSSCCYSATGASADAHIQRKHETLDRWPDPSCDFRHAPVYRFLRPFSSRPSSGLVASRLSRPRRVRLVAGSCISVHCFFSSCWMAASSPDRESALFPGRSADSGKRPVCDRRRPYHRVGSFTFNAPVAASGCNWANGGLFFGGRLHLLPSDLAASL